MRFILLTDISLAQWYIYILNLQKEMRERKRKHKEKYGWGSLISGFSLLQNSETAFLWKMSYSYDSFMSMSIWKYRLFEYQFKKQWRILKVEFPNFLWNWLNFPILSTWTLRKEYRGRFFLLCFFNFHIQLDDKSHQSFCEIPPKSLPLFSFYCHCPVASFYPPLPVLFQKPYTGLPWFASIHLHSIAN